MRAIVRDRYYPVSLVAPLAGNERALGYDLGSEPLRRAALAEAERTGLPTATDPITLVQQTGSQKGMLICRPVFGGGNRRQLRGFAVAVLQMESLLWSASPDESVFMGLSLLRRGAAPQPLAISWSSDTLPGTGLDAARPVFAFGKVFTVNTHAGPGFMRLNPVWAGWLTVLVGLVLTAAISGMVGMILRGRVELERLVFRRTAALRESEDRYVQLAEQSGTITWEVDGSGLFTYASHVVENVLGYRPDELVGRICFHDLLYFGPGDDEFRETSIARFQAMEPFQSLENAARTRDGRVVWLSTNAIPIPSASGAPRGYRGSSTDITQHKQAEMLLRESEEKHRTILQAAMAGFFLVDTAGRLLEVNETYCRMSGYNARELLEMRISDLESVETPDEVACHIRRVMEQGADRFESRHRRRDGSVFDVEISIQYLPVGEGWLVTFLQDITQRKLAEGERARLETQLNQAQKMESVGRLAGGVAHDFNNMLSVILGHAELALMKSEQSPALHANLKEIRDAAERSADLTRQLLAFARKQTIIPRVLDLNETVEGMLKMLKRLIGENIHLSWHPAAGLWPVKVDPSQIDQILANLCVNARDAISGVGTLSIETGNSLFDEAYCAGHAGFESGEYVRLAVSDTGCGMAREVLEHIFEPFFTTKELGKGTGLGLATVYGAVKQNNGFINVYSEPGQGTTFSIYLPRSVAGTGDEQRPAPAAPAARGNETILLVEDEQSILDMTTTMLEMQGYTVLPARTPGEAIQLAGAQAGQIHLLMSDVIMPEMNGRELSERLLSRYPKLACLFMSGYTADVIAHHGVLDEGVHFIQKPFSVHGLAAKIRETLDNA